MKKYFSFLEKLLGLNLEYAFYQGSQVIYKEAMLVILGLLVTYLFTNFTPKSTFAVYILTLSFSGIFASIALPGVNTALIKYLSKNSRISIKNMLKLKLAALFFTSFFIFALGFFYYARGDETIAYCLGVLGIFFPLQNLFLLYEPMLIATKKFAVKSIFNLVHSVIVTSSIAFSIFLRLEVTYLIALYLFASTLVNFIFFVYTVRLFSWRSNKHLYFFKYSVQISSVYFINSISSQLEKVLLGSSLGFNSLAIYSTGKTIPDGVQSINKTIMEIYVVKLAEKNLKQNKLIFLVYFWRLIALGFLIYIVIWFFTPLVFSWLLPASYVGAVSITRILSTLIILVPLNVILSSIIAFHGTYKDNLIYNLPPQILRIFLLLFLVPSLGILGILIAVFVERTLTTIVQILLVLKK